MLQTDIQKLIYRAAVPWIVIEDESGVRIERGRGEIMSLPEWEATKAKIELFYQEYGAHVDDHNAEIDRRLMQDRIDRPENYAPAPKREEGYIYLLHGDGTSWYKIGVSKNPKSRIKNIGCQAPFQVTTLAIFATDDMMGDEEAWHQRFANNRVGGEWFELTSTEVDLFLAEGGHHD